MHITITANYPFFPISLKEAWQQVLDQLWLSFFCNQYCSNLDLNILHSYYRKVSITLPTDDTHPLASKYKNALHLNCTMQLLPTFHHTATSHLGKLGVCVQPWTWSGRERKERTNTFVEVPVADCADSKFSSPSFKIPTVLKVLLPQLKDKV